MEDVVGVPDADGGVDLRLLVDASVVEVFPGAVAAARLRSTRGPGQVAVRADGARLEHLVLHGMERVLH